VLPRPARAGTTGTRCCWFARSVPSGRTGTPPTGSCWTAGQRQGRATAGDPIRDGGWDSASQPLNLNSILGARIEVSQRTVAQSRPGCLNEGIGRPSTERRRRVLAGSPPRSRSQQRPRRTASGKFVHRKLYRGILILRSCRRPARSGTGTGDAAESSTQRPFIRIDRLAGFRAQLPAVRAIRPARDSLTVVQSELEPPPA
jgi:hypothetical protein